MKNSRIVLSVLLVLLVIVSQFALSATATNEQENDVSGTTVSTNDNYVVKFSPSQNNRFISSNEMSTLLGQPISNGGEYEIEDKTDGANVVYNNDGSMTLSKEIGLYGANLEVPVTDEIKEMYKKNTSHNLIVSFYLSKSLSEEKLFSDTQIRIYTRFKNAGTIELDDEKYTSYLAYSSLGKVFSKAYKPYIDKKFNLLDFNKNVLENLDDVESIIISLYQFNYTDASLEFSGIAFDNTSPNLKKYVAPTPEPANKSVPLIRYRREYDKKWAGHPSTVKYSSVGGFNSSDYKATDIGSLYLKNINEVFSKQLTIYYDFDIDEFNKGILTANQDGGSKQAYITLHISKLLDSDDKEMLGQFELQFFMFDESIITLNQVWLKQNETKTVKFDISNIDINSVSYIKLNIQNYWKYCEADGRYYDYDKKVEKEGKVYCTDNLGNENVDVTNKNLVDRTMKNVEAFISAIYTVGDDIGVSTTTLSNSTTQTQNDDYEYAGYHFIDFKQEALDETYGNNPSNIDFLFDNYYQRYSLDNHTYKNNNSSGTKIDGNDDYKAEFKSNSSQLSGGYQLQINSGFEKTQTQYQSSYWKSGKIEDANRTKKTQDHDPLPAQGENYDYSQQMGNAIKYANNNPDPKLKGYLAIDVHLVSSVHGYKNTQNKTYQAWCKKNNEKCVDTNSNAEVQISIHATDKKGIDCSVTTTYNVNVGQKTTLFLDVSELDVNNITNVRVVAQNYGNLANKEQGGDNEVCGLTNVTTRFSAIYVPGKKQSEGITTTVNVTRAFSLKDAKRIKKLYDALPGLSVDDYNTENDYKKLAKFIKAWSKASDTTQKYCEKNHKIDYAIIGMLEQDVYEKIYGANSDNSDYLSNDESPLTNDTSFPIFVLLIAVLSGILVIKTYRKKV